MRDAAGEPADGFELLRLPQLFFERAPLKLDLEALRGRYAASLRIAMNGQADAKRLQQVLAPYRASGACQVLVRYENGAAACEIALGDAWRVRPDGRLLAELDAWLTPGNVQLVYNGVS